MQRNKKAEEIVNSITHGVGIAGSVACTAILIVHASAYSAWHIVSCSIFGAGLIFLYTASTLFHGAKNVRRKFKLNKMDHSAIYILIASTFSPLTMVVLHNALGWVIFGLMWAMAIAGVVFKLWFYTAKLRKLSTWLYLGMSWPALLGLHLMLKRMPAISLWFLLFGCLSYAVSSYFYLNRKIPYGHGIFHLFILGGSAFHFLCFYYLLKMPIV